MPYLQSATQAPLRDFAFGERLADANPAQRSLRGVRYKLVETANAQDQFFDLENDPFEQNDLLRRTLSATEQYHYDVLAAELARLAGDASWFTFGSGCAGNAGVPRLANTSSSTPRLGATLRVTIDRLGTSPAVVGMLGFSNENFGLIPLPFDLAALGMPTCNLLVSADVNTVLVPSSGIASWNTPLPNLNTILGLRFYQQAFALDANANAFGATVSNAAYAVIERN